MWNNENNKKRFIKYLNKEKIPFLLAVLIISGSVACDLYIPLLIRNIFDGAKAQLNSIVISISMIVGFYALGNLAKFLYNYILCFSSNKVIASAQRDSINNLVAIDYKRFAGYNKGQVLNRLTQDFKGFEHIIQTIAPSAVSGITYIGIAVIILLRMNLALTICAVSVVVFYIAAFLFFNERISKLYRRTNALNDEITENTQDIVNGVKDIKLWGNMAKVIEHFTETQKKYFGGILVFKSFSNASRQIYELVKGVGIALIIGIGSYYVSKSVLTFGELFAFVMYLGNIYTPAIDLLDVGHDYNKAVSNIERAFELYCEGENVCSLPEPEIKSIESIEFENVSFAYGENLVLYNLNMQLKKGSHYALIGKTGAGKSTLLNVILGLYQPVGGIIKVNGRQLAYAEYQNMYSLMKTVLQDSYVFNRTIEENIRLFNDGDINEILDKSCLNELGDRLDMPAGQNAGSLSGGQRQRLLLTRIFSMGSDVLILDEVTSALDEGTEMQVLKNICDFHKDAIIIFCSHQKAILELADRVLDLSGMKVNEADNAILPPG